MSTYGAAYLQWAPFAAENAETAEALPKLGTPMNLGALNKVVDAPNVTEVTADGDNRVQDSLSEFLGGTVDVDITELDNPVAAALYGAEQAGEGEDLAFGVDDEAPYGSLAFYVNKVKGKKKFYQGIYYPKLKAVLQGSEHNTRAKAGITLTGGKLHFNWEAPLFGKYLYKSAPLNTEAEAKAWVDEKIKAST